MMFVHYCARTRAMGPLRNGFKEPPMPYANYTPQEVAARGEALYEQRIRNTVEAEHKGRFLVLDIETGMYEIDEDDLIATKRLLARQPQAVTYGLRIGYPTAYRLGAHFAPSAP